jgi:hypothetical protein
MMHDRNGTPLQPGELVRYRDEDVDVTAEVLRAGPEDIVVLAVPMPDLSGMGPMATHAFDQMMAAARNKGTPSGCVPVGASRDSIEKLGG